MSGLVNLFQNRISSTCISKSGLKKEGCRVRLEKFSELHLVIDFDKSGSPLDQSQIRCDYLFVAEFPKRLGLIAPLELKSTKISAGRIKLQLEAGAKVAENILPHNMEVDFQPILASTTFHHAERYALKKKNNRIKFRNNSYPIKRMKCNSPLRNVI